MAWYNAILGGNGSPLMNSTTASIGNAYAATQRAPGSIVAINGAAQSSYFTSENGAMYTVKNYADAIGWSLTHHHLPSGVTSDDPKIAILKIASIGQVLKDVGVRTSDTDFYIMRDPND